MKNLNNQRNVTVVIYNIIKVFIAGQKNNQTGEKVLIDGSSVVIGKGFNDKTPM